MNIEREEHDECILISNTINHQLGYTSKCDMNFNSIIRMCHRKVYNFWPHNGPVSGPSGVPGLQPALPTAHAAGGASDDAGQWETAAQRWREELRLATCGMVEFPAEV